MSYRQKSKLAGGVRQKWITTDPRNERMRTHMRRKVGKTRPWEKVMKLYFAEHRRASR